MVTIIVIVIVFFLGKFIYDTYLTDNTDRKYNEYLETKRIVEEKDKLKQRWRYFLNEGTITVSERILTDFLLRYSVDPTKYISNEHLLSYGMSVQNPSPSAVKFQNALRNAINGGILFPDWFIYSFPEVMIWLMGEGNKYISIFGKAVEDKINEENKYFEPEILNKILFTYRTENKIVYFETSIFRNT